MPKADCVFTTPPTSSPTTRRRFLSQAAGVATGGAVLALAAVPPASLADDLVRLGPQSITQPLLAAADAEIIAAGEKFESLLGKYLDARFIWAKLARDASAKTEAKFESAPQWEGSTKDDPKWDFIPARCRRTARGKRPKISTR